MMDDETFADEQDDTSVLQTPTFFMPSFLDPAERVVEFAGHTWIDRGERDDPDSVFYDGRYTGPSEFELGGGCNRCGCPDDCMCNG
jgi:hypothetical protein